MQIYENNHTFPNIYTQILYEAWGLDFGFFVL